MAKGKTSIFFCQSCGYESSKWMGQCPGCKEWNTFVEEVVDKKSADVYKRQVLCGAFLKGADDFTGNIVSGF